jgi:hypothetical protein
VPTIVATAGAANANSFQTLVEAQAYFDSRVAVAGWDNADDQNALLIMATRVMEMTLSPYRMFVPPKGGQSGYYRTRPTWTGLPTSSTQALSWPRTGMYNRNGFAIADSVIPQDLKNAHAELAGALGTKDLMLDNDIAVQGITSVKAGSVSVSFADGAAMTAKTLPESVLYLLVPSWLTEELIEGMYKAEFEVIV